MRILIIFVLMLTMISACNSIDIKTNPSKQAPQVITSTTKQLNNIIFQDKSVEDCIRFLLEKEKGDITFKDMETIKNNQSIELFGDTKNIQDIINFFPNLKKLIIANYISNDDIFTKLNELKNLSYLSLSYSGNGKKLNIDGLTQQSKLKFLELNSENIIISDVSLMNKLKYLISVSFNSVKKFDPDIIVNIPNIEQINLELCEFTDINIFKIIKN